MFRTVAKWYKPVSGADVPRPDRPPGAPGDALRFTMRLGVSPMRARIIGAAVLVGVALAVVASTASGGTQAASSITVWLQVDAQATNWEPIVKAANAAFQKDHPGVAVNVQYQTWGNHLQKFDATLAGGIDARRHRDGEHRDDEVHGRGSLPGPDVARRARSPNSGTWLDGLAASGRYGGKLYGVPYYAGSRVVTYRTDLFKKAGIKVPTSLAQFTAAAQEARPRRTSRRGSRPSTSPARTGTSRWASSTTSAARSRPR